MINVLNGLKHGGHVVDFHQISDNFFHFRSNFFGNLLLFADRQRQEHPNQVTIQNASGRIGWQTFCRLYRSVLLGI